MRQYSLTEARSQGPVQVYPIILPLSTLCYPFLFVLYFGGRESVVFGVVLTIVLTEAVTYAEPFAFSHRRHNGLIFCFAIIL